LATNAACELNLYLLINKGVGWRLRFIIQDIALGSGAGLELTEF